MSQLTFDFPSLAVAILGHIYASAILHSRRLHVKGTCVKTKHQCDSMHSFSSDKQTFQRLESFFLRGQRWLTHRCVKSNVLLVRVEIFVLLPAELTNVAPSFCGQGKQTMRH